MIRLHCWIALQASAAKPSKGSFGNVSLESFASTKFMRTVLRDPLCHVPVGKDEVVSQPMDSFEIFVTWALWEFWWHHSLYFAESAENRPSTWPESSCSDNKARTEPKKYFKTPRCIVWNQSKFQRHASFPGSCRRWVANGEGSKKGSWTNSVASHAGRRVSICSNGYSDCPALHIWQIPTGGDRTFTLFWMLLKLREKEPHLWRNGQSPMIPSTTPQYLGPCSLLTPVSHM